MTNFSVLITLLASIVTLVSAQAAEVDSASKKQIKGDCGIVGFQESSPAYQIPLPVKDRILPYRIDVADCISYCTKELGDPTPDGKGCQTVLWSLLWGQCLISSTSFDSSIHRNVRGDKVFYKPGCYEKYKDGKSTYPVIAAGQG